METILTYIALLLGIGALILVGGALAMIFTEKPASHWASERKKLNDECPPWWR